MRVKIYQPAKTAMQSGVANTRKWLLEPEEENTRFIEPLMGWTGNTDTKGQLRLSFGTKDEAVAYAKSNGMEFQVIEPKKRKFTAKSYSDNFK